MRNKIEANFNREPELYSHFRRMCRIQGIYQVDAIKQAILLWLSNMPEGKGLINQIASERAKRVKERVELVSRFIEGSSIQESGREDKETGLLYYFLVPKGKGKIALTLLRKNLLIGNRGDDLVRLRII